MPYFDRIHMDMLVIACPVTNPFSTPFLALDPGYQVAGSENPSLRISIIESNSGAEALKLLGERKATFAVASDKALEEAKQDAQNTGTGIANLSDLHPVCDLGKMDNFAMVLASGILTSDAQKEILAEGGASLVFPELSNFAAIVRQRYPDCTMIPCASPEVAGSAIAALHTKWPIFILGLPGWVNRAIDCAGLHDRPQDARQVFGASRYSLYSNLNAVLANNLVKDVRHLLTHLHKLTLDDITKFGEYGLRKDVLATILTIHLLPNFKEVLKRSNVSYSVLCLSPRATVTFWEHEVAVANLR